MSSKSQKRKNKKKYFQSSKKFKSGGALESGMKGFLITCNDERRCIKEAYNLLNEFADELYGPEFDGTEKKDCDEELDVEEQLAKELSVFTSKKRRFQQVSTKAKNTIFINTTVPDPVALVDNIYESVLKTGQQKTRFILKFKPVLVTCKANESEIKKNLEEIFLKMSSEEINKELTYKVESKVKHNDNITSSHLIWYVRDCAKDVLPGWTACIVEPQIIVSFYVLRTICCISVLKKYSEYKKYNLCEITSPSTLNTANKEHSNENKTASTEASVVEASENIKLESEL